MLIRDDIHEFAAAWTHINIRACRRWRPVVNWAFSGRSALHSAALRLVGFALRVEAAPLMLRYWFGLPLPRGL
jgi:hypothetical protein